MISRDITMVGVFIGISFTPTLAQFDSGSDGSDGAFNPQSSLTIDLSLAATGSWDMPSPVPGQGVYDPDKWAVVFKYTTIDIPNNVEVLFSNHPSGAPVVWLASDDVTIGGTVLVNGSRGSDWPADPLFSTPGPGGFGGGRYDLVPPLGEYTAGFGPGAIEYNYGYGGSYGTSADGLEYIYGNETIVPLIGGSGSGGWSGGVSNEGGGAGGGAILIASSGDIVFDNSGRITADGGYGGYHHSSGCCYSGGGSGGAIRLVANAVSSPSTSNLRAFGNRGYGRIRVEAFTIDMQGSVPPWTSSTPGPVFPPSGSPTLRVASVDSVPVPTDPLAGIVTPDVAIDTDQPVTLNIEATNIPVGTTVRVHIVPEQGDAVRADSTPLVNVGGGLLTATYTTTLPRGKCEIQLRANWTP